MSYNLIEEVREMGEHPSRADLPMGKTLRNTAEYMEALLASNEQWQVDYNETVLDNLQLQADNAKMREALKRIARYDIGLQALIEDGADTPENRAKYYEGRVEYRRSIARAALQETER